MFTQLEHSLLSLAHNMPLEQFMFISSFIEEVIAPIPSPSVVVLSGSFASAQGWLLPQLVILALLGALGKTLGALIVYLVTDTAEDFIMGRLGKYFSVTHEDIERLGKKLGNGWRDYLLLTSFRMLPFVPSSVISVGCGLLKVPIRLYIVTTFVGTILRDSVYLYIGYAGTELFKTFLERSASIETMLEFTAVLAFIGGITYIYWRRRQSDTN